jgi:hypothetical protein
MGYAAFMDDRRDVPTVPFGDPETAESDPDFATEHNRLWVESDHGETESPKGHSGLEPTKRPN